MPIATHYRLSVFFGLVVDLLCSNWIVHYVPLAFHTHAPTMSSYPFLTRFRRMQLADGQAMRKQKAKGEGNGWEYRTRASYTTIIVSALLGHRGPDSSVVCFRKERAAFSAQAAHISGAATVAWHKFGFRGVGSGNVSQNLLASTSLFPGPSFWSGQLQIACGATNVATKPSCWLATKPSQAKCEDTLFNDPSAY